MIYLTAVLISLVSMLIGAGILALVLYLGYRHELQNNKTTPVSGNLQPTTIYTRKGA